MRSVLRLGLVLLVTLSGADGAFELRPVSAEGGGTADAGSVVAAGVEGLFSNPGSMVCGSAVDAAAFSATRFGLSELTTQGAGAVFGGPSVSGGVGFLRFGSPIFREQSLLVGLAMRLRGRVGLGIRVRLLNLGGQGFDPRHWLVFDVGTRTALSDGLALGLTAWNAGGVGPGLLGRGGAAGLSVRVMEETMVSVEVRKDAGRPTGLRAGLTFEFLSRLTLRLGAGHRPETLAAGAGVRLGRLVLDYSSQDHAVLGRSYRWSIRFQGGGG